MSKESKTSKVVGIDSLQNEKFEKEWAIELNEWVDYMAELLTQKYKRLDKSRLFASLIMNASFVEGSETISKQIS